MTIDFDAFEEMEFPKHGNIVYVFHYVRAEGTEPLPFYVGESSRHVGRFGDYMSANFSASTDFKVGEAIKYLRHLGLRVVVKFIKSHSRKDDEKQIIQQFRRTCRLLNDLKGYSYRSADADVERRKIQQFIDSILENPNNIPHIAKARRASRSAEGVLDFAPRQRSVRREDLDGAAPAPPKSGITLKEEASNGSIFGEIIETSSARSPYRASSDENLSVPERVRLICQELAVGGTVIKRQDIIRIAKERGINGDSVLPADYCDNTETGKWSKHSFLHSVSPGRYILR